MDRYYTQTVGSAIITTNGMPISRVVEIVIEPETGKVVGFLLGPRGQSVIAPADVIFWEDSIFIHDEEDILETTKSLKSQQFSKKILQFSAAKSTPKKGSI